jgi:elongation factor P--(R)-beta-lysine ligase
MNIDLLKGVRIHEHVVIAILIKIGVLDRLNERPLHCVGCFVAHNSLHTIRDAPHVDGCRRRALARVHAFGLQDDVELAVFMFDDVALADAAGDDFNHGCSLFSETVLECGALLAGRSAHANPHHMTKTMPDSPWFSPHRHADRRAFLLQRNRIISALRDWFGEREFLEVDVPALAISPGNEAHLHAFTTEIVNSDGSREPRYLHTSPEFACKKLLAAGEERIFSLGHVFRNRERTRTHAPEFTMLEWYRAREPYQSVIDDTLAVVALAAQEVQCAAFHWKDQICDPAATAEWLTVNDAFIKYAGLDLLQTLDAEGRPDVSLLAELSPVAYGQGESWSDLFSRILVEKVERHLGKGCVTVLYEYPACEAALARTCAQDARVAERFELYACGVELANGFGELTNAVEQRRRFNEEMDIKQRIYGERYPIDEDLLKALAMMPEASGVALGLDRLIMLATGAARIDQVQWVPVA